ncbi:MAG: hypothetical protein ABIJ91_03825 [Candidatus Kuenenbacteria bacterium]
MDIKQDITAGAGAPASQPTSIDKPKSRNSKGSGKGLKVVIMVLVVVILVVIAGYLVDKYTSLNLLEGSGQDHANVYSAVFLSNGQVYFGQMVKVENGHTELTDIYYLQAYNPPLQQAPNQQAVGQPQLSLVKLGNELHGPEDQMEINNDHIVFIENLKSDSKVVEAILKYKEEQTK